MTILTDREIVDVLNKEMVIHPVDTDECLSPLGYDLRIGYVINLEKPIESLELEPTGKIVIPPKTSTFIITKEHVWLSDRLVGTLHSRGSLAASGLIINSTTVDPNWAGQMTFLVHNIGNQPIELDKDARFVTMILHRVKKPTDEAPMTNPVNAADKWGKIYGQNFSMSLLRYLTTNEIQIQKKNFEKLVQVAKRPTSKQIMAQSIKSMGDAIKLFFTERFSGFFTVILWLLNLTILVATLTLQWYWGWLQQIFNFADPYGPSILAGQIAVILSSLAVISALLTNKN